MSTTDSRTVDPAQPHYSPNMGHEMSDFSWTTVLWLLPISVCILVTFTLVCMFWFRGFKESESVVKQSEFPTTELNILHAKENEVLSQYKIVDKDKGRYQIPIAKAMELVVAEHQNVDGREWKPITDTYMANTVFAAPAAEASKATSSDISIESVPETKHAPAKHSEGKEKKGH
jgi:hypothetical protein